MAERKGSDGGSDDLFEDLDEFFSSIDEEEWPEPIVPGGAPPSAQPPPEAVARPREPEPVRSEPVQPETVHPEPVESETVQAEPVQPETVQAEPMQPETVHPEPVEQEPGIGRRKEDMSSEDWSRLRDVLGEDGEDEDEVEFAFPEPPETASESLFGYAGAEADEGEDIEAMPGAWETGGGRGGGREDEESAEEPGELTVDDLRKTPPQYRDLPGPPESPYGERPAAGPPSAVEELDLGAEPSLADVEAAADRVAGEFAPPSGSDEPAGSSRGDTTYTGPTHGGAPGAYQPGELSQEPDDISGATEDDLLADLAEPRGPRKVKVGEPESLTGPAWEDPTAHTLGGEPRGPRISGRNIPVAVASAVALAVAALIALAIHRAAFAVVAGAVVLIAQFEFYMTTQRRGYHPAVALGFILGGLTLAAAYLKGESAMVFIVALGVVLSFLWYMSAPPKARSGSLANIGVTVFGVLYVPFLASFALLVLTQAASGRALMLAVIGLTFLYDVAAFFVGSFYGSRPLAPTISPKKSWEGLAAATLITFAISLAFVSRLGPMDVPNALGLALMVVVFAPLGDLAESAIKRDLGVKDMGSIMPGHGGALDRIDSVLFVAPACFYFLRLVF